MSSPLSPQVQEWRKASDDQIREWAERHDLRGSLTELREIFEDAQSLAPSAVPFNQVVQERLPRHKFWGAGEPDCPQDIKGANGELHTMRCKVCGDGWRKSTNVCFGPVAAGHRPSPEWYATMIAKTLDDDFAIGHHKAGPEPIYWKHRKTGGVYQLLGHAKLQTDSPLVDMANVTVYQGEDGKLWARAANECASRFDRVDVFGALAASPQPVSQPGEALPAEQPKSDKSYALVGVGKDLLSALPEGTPQTPATTTKG